MDIHINFKKKITEPKSSSFLQNLWKTNKSDIKVWALISSAYLVLIVFYWAPFSWNSMPYHDKWNLGFQSTSGFRLHYLITVIYDFIKARSHAQDIYSLGHLISKNSFLGLNIILAATFYFKSLFTYALTKKIFRENILIAFLAGVFVSIWPTDELWFELDFTSYHLGSLFLVIALYLFIRYFQNNKLYLFILATYFLIWSLSIIEHAIFTALLAPILLYLLDMKITKRLVVFSVIWSIPSMIKLFSFGLALLSKSPTRNYELNMLDSANPVSISVVWKTIKFCYKQSFYSWIGRLNEYITPDWNRFDNKEIITYAILSGVLVGVVIGIIHFTKFFDHLKDQNGMGSFGSDLKKYGVVFLYCLASIYIAYFLFVPTTYRFSTIRTFIYSSLWIGISASLLIWFISLLFVNKKLFYIGIASIFTFLVVLSSLISRSNMHDFTNRSFGDTIPIYEKIPSIKNNTVIVIIDHTPTEMGFYKRQEILTLNRMVRFAYNDDSLYTVICRDDKYFCSFEKDRFIVDILPKGLAFGVEIPNEFVEENNLKLQAFSYDRLVIFNYENYDHFELIHEVPAEYKSNDMINSTPLEYQPQNRIGDQYRPDFSVPNQRLKTFFGYALKYLEERNILSTNRVVNLIGY